jgi:choline monooxygenase
VMRTEADRVRAFHNVCRHRAGPLATCDGKGAKALRCRYHGWTYGLDGVLRSAPEMSTAPDFDPSSIRLPELQVTQWQGLIFVAAGKVPPLAEVVAGIDARIGAGALSGYRFHRRVAYEVACNWKVYVDNYLEGYHVPHIHPTLNALLDYRSYVTEVQDWYSYQYSPMQSAGDLYGAGDAFYYFIYPNTMLNILPDRLQTNRVQPLGPERCRVEFDYFYPVELGSADDEDAARARRERDHVFSHVVQDEDIAICESVQKGLASGSYVPGRLNPLRENAVHHFQEILRRVYRQSGLQRA